MQSSPSLLSIIAHARSGALDHAWRLFREAGLEAVDDDPAVLSVRGRLFKDRALAATGAERQGFYRQAAEAYGRAGAISGETYPLINAATLALLAGDAGQARRRAGGVLARLDSGEAEPDTAYYSAATRAEALLLSGDGGAARTALAQAMALAPRAWEDHASTLRQFALILEATGEDAAWLDPLRPPRSLHFAGHMAVASGDGAVARQVRDLLEAERVGFGFGALAAGADIVVAEALLDHGAELHLVLPAPAVVFRQASVVSRGADWGERFDAALARAATVRVLGHPDDPQYAPGVKLAAEAAMGQAAMQARTLSSEALQLLVLDDEADADAMVGGSAWMGEAWRDAGRRGQVIVAPRTGGTTAPPERPSGVLAALLEIEIAGPEGGLTAAEHWARTTLAAAAEAIAAGPAPVVPPNWRGGSVRLAYASPLEAADAARAVIAALPEGTGRRIAGDYGLAWRSGSPGPLLVGPAVESPAAILRSAPPGAVWVTETFAWALQIAPAGRAPRVEYVGELPGSDVEAPIGLFSLKL